MTVQMVIEVQDRQGAQTILQALDGYKIRLNSGIERTKRRLATFEARYGVETARFLREMTAEDLAGGDIEYAELHQGELLENWLKIAGRKVALQNRAASIEVRFGEHYGTSNSPRHTIRDCRPLHPTSAVC